MVSWGILASIKTEWLKTTQSKGKKLLPVPAYPISELFGSELSGCYCTVILTGTLQKINKPDPPRFF